MKKILFVAPLMAISLIGCNKGGGDNPGPVINTYTFTFNCPGCKVLDKQGNVVTTVEVPVTEGSTDLYTKFYLKGDDLHHSPLGSSVVVKQGTEQVEDYFYKPTTGEIALPLVSDLTITAEGFNKTLEECTWDQINEISTTGRAEEFFDVYDPNKPDLNCKKVYLKNQDFAHTVRIIGFNHDDLADGSGNKAGITFEFADVITKNNKTDKYSTIWGDTSYDYSKSTLNTFLNDETIGAKSVINMLPDDLSKKGIIKLVDKFVGISTDEGQYYTATSFETKLFPLAYDEIHIHHHGISIPGEDGGNGIYEYYQGHDGDEDSVYRIKKIVDGSDGVRYWLRSPVNGGGIDQRVFSVTESGAMSLNGKAAGIDANAVAPAFCI